MEHGDGGYRVWLDGSDHCFWVPEARFLLSPLYIGLSVSFGGFWNPLGYYNIYDYGPTFGAYYGNSYYGGAYYGAGYYGGGYYGNAYYGRPYYGGSYYGNYYGNNYYGNSYSTSSVLQGYVDRFDDLNGTLVVRDDRSGGYITVVIRGGDPQFRYLQPGDWVAFAGAWTRDGYFEAYRVDDLAPR